MRVILDTNVLLSALLTRGTPPSALYDAWRAGRFSLASCEQQFDEIRRVCRRPFFQSRLRPAEIGRLVNGIKRLALMHEPDRHADVSPGPGDDFCSILLA
jgi:predicted nucleic acid-binding protein